MTDAYLVGVKLVASLDADQSLCTALRTLTGPFDLLADGYPEWHPAPYAFEGMVRLFLYRELTGESYRALGRYPELAGVFDLEKIPMNRFSRGRGAPASTRRLGSSSRRPHTMSSRKSMIGG